MAQLTDTVLHYFPVLPRRGRDLLEVVREHCIDLRATAPKVAWTYASHDRYRTCTLVANIAYSVLGWASSPSPSSEDGIKKYLILRHRWDVTEPVVEAERPEIEDDERPLSQYPGVVLPHYGLNADLWPPVELGDWEGVCAIKTGAFQDCFAGLDGVGVAK